MAKRAHRAATSALPAAAPCRRGHRVPIIRRTVRPDAAGRSRRPQVRMRPRLIAIVFAVAAVAAAFAARTHDTRAAAIALDGPGAIAQLVGSQLAVVVVTVHNGSHATITSTTVGSTVH